MRLPFWLVDAFVTDQDFSGNPAGVCLLDSELPADTMQSIAAQAKQAETAFVVPTLHGFNLRWFTPEVEVALCGHATLASAHALWESGLLALDSEAVFHTASGDLRCKRLDDLIEMDFPAVPSNPIPTPQELIDGLRATPTEVWMGKFDVLAIFPSEGDILTLDPDMATLNTIQARGVCATAPGVQCDFVSRFFAPQSGVPEDDATGSAHCMLAPYWSKRLGKNTFEARQLSHRGAALSVDLKGDRVKLRGLARIALEGTWCL